MKAGEIRTQACKLLEELCEKQKTYVLVVYDPELGLAEIGFSMAPPGALRAVEFAGERIKKMIERRES